MACGAKKTEKIPATDEHNYIIMDVDSDVYSATIGDDGSKTYTCTGCGTQDVEVIPAVAPIKVSASSFVYTGKVRRPAVTVTDRVGDKLPTDKYRVKYSEPSSKAPGKYTVTVSAGDDEDMRSGSTYYFSKTLTYKILPRQVTGLKVSKTAKDQITLTWTKLAEAKYYKVEQSADGKTWKAAATVSANTATVKNLKAGTKYQFRVKALDAKKAVAGKVSAVVKTGTRTAAPVVTLRSTKSKTATASWKKVAGATKYIVWKSTDNKKWTKVTTTTKLTVTLTKLAAGKRIYVKVYAVNAFGRNSAASKVKYVTVKK